MPTILAVETSCDESAAAVVRDRQVLASAVASQVEEHAGWGGVVPEIASRRHVEALPQLVERVMAESGLRYGHLDGIAAQVYLLNWQIDRSLRLPDHFNGADLFDLVATHDDFFEGQDAENGPEQKANDGKGTGDD